MSSISIQEMPRRKQNKPQHCGKDETSTTTRQQNNMDYTATNSNQTSAITKDSTTATTVNGQDNSITKDSNSSLDEMSLDAADAANISGSDWLSVKATLSSLQQQIQMLRLQQFQIMQLLTTKSQNMAASPGSSSPSLTGTDTKQMVGPGTAPLLEADGLAVATKQNSEVPGVANVLRPECDVANEIGNESEKASEKSDCDDQLNRSMDSNAASDDAKERLDVTSSDERQATGEDDSCEQHSFDCDTRSAVLPDDESLRLHRSNHGESSPTMKTSPQNSELSSPEKTAIPSNPFLNSFNSTAEGVTTNTPVTSQGSLPPYHPVITDFTNDDSLEEFMEIQKPENTHLEQLAKNLDGTITDPNQCLICKRVLSCKSALMMHYRTHTGERPFRCKLCSRAFTTKGNLKTHMGVHRAKPPMRLLHTCTVCNKQFTNALVLNQHLKMHQDEANRKRGLDVNGLAEDSKRSKFSSSIKNEIAEAFSSKVKPADTFNPLSGSLGFPFDLGVIPSMQGHLRYAEAFARQWEQLHQISMFNPLAAVSNHASMFLPGMPLAAANGSLRLPLLDQTNNGIASPSKPSPDSQIELQVNIPHTKGSDAEISSSQPANQSEKTTPVSTNDHISSPKSEKSWDSNETGSTTTSMRLDPPPGTTCDICSKTFACRSALEIHYRSHTKQRPFKCEICDKAFTTKGNMKQHVLTHKSDDMQWPSQDKSSRSHGSSPSGPQLERTFSGEDLRRSSSKHQCSVCLKYFSSASAVQIHFRTHTGDRPFKCTVCAKSFTTKGNLKVHMGTHMWSSGQQAKRDLKMPTTSAADEIETADGSFPDSVPITSTSHTNNDLEWSNMLKNGFLGANPSAPPSFMRNYPSLFMSSPPPGLGMVDDNKPWLWQVTCPVCNKECQSPVALELHVKTHVPCDSSPITPVTAS